MEKLREEDVAALRVQFDALVEQVLPEVMASAIKLTRSREVAWDCTMEAWWEVLNNFPSIRQKEPVPFKVYFLRVMRSKYADWLKRQWNVLPLGFVLEDDPVLGVAFADPLELSEIEDPRLLQALDHLSTHQRHALFLCADGYTPEECAALLLIEVEQYTNLLEEARQLVQRELRPCSTPVEQPQPPAQSRTRPMPHEVEPAPTDGGWLTLQTLSREVGRSRVWVENRLGNLGIGPTYFRDAMGRVAAYYPCEVTCKLRESQQEVKPIGDWLTIPQLSRRLGMDRGWVIAELQELGDEGEKRLISASGRTDLCFHPSVLAPLEQRASQYQPAPGGWYTLQGLVKQLRQSRGWIERRLTSIGDEPKLFKDARGALREHYPPSTRKQLEVFKQEQEEKRNRSKWFELPDN